MLPLDFAIARAEFDAEAETNVRRFASAALLTCSVPLLLVVARMLVEFRRLEMEESCDTLQ